MNRYLETLDELGRLESGENTPGDALSKLTKAPFVSFDTEPLGLSRNEEMSDCGTPNSRRAWSDRLCARLSEAIARQAPAGLGYWEPAWKLVEAPSKALLDTLAGFELSGSDRAREQARHRAQDVLEAWHAAAVEWERTGKSVDSAPSKREESR